MAPPTPQHPNPRPRPRAAPTFAPIALLLLAALLLLLTPPRALAQGGSRVALVVGNAAYREAPLLNPVNDARAMAAALREAGFEVQLHTDIDQRGLVAAVRTFGDRLRKASVGVFYFAGHGMQIKGRNYLVPVGAEIQREDEVAYATLDAQAVLDKMESAGNGTNVMILDACRNNPFARSFRSSQQGLAQMDAPVGTLVAFATAPGSVASDGTGQHGLYTQHLLQEIRAPGAKVEEVFKRVRAAVRRDSAGKQVPWESTSLEGDLTFFAARPAPPAVPVATRPEPPQQARPAAAVVPPALPMPAATTPERDRRTAELLAELQRQPPRPEARPAGPGTGTGTGTTASAGSSNYRVGEHWSYQVIDRQRGEVTRNYTLRVHRLLPDGGWQTAAESRFDALGRLVEQATAGGETRRFSPHALRWWEGLQAGQQRTFEVEVQRNPPGGAPYRQVMSAESRVVGRETVRVPAGEFVAWRIEHRATVRNVGPYGAGSVDVVIWYVPELKTYAAMETRNFWNGQSEPAVREELTAYTLAAR